ncbi:AAA family ATPase [Phytohabitans rumicis]|nr:MoxR family ATPase [Phytohabitans rumicis]
MDTAERDRRWPPPPEWRDFPYGPDVEPPPADEREFRRRLGDIRPFRVEAHEVRMVNAAIYLRRPLLVTGRPGVGKSSLAYRIARELRLGPVLRWPITSRATLRSALYEYDAIGRAQAIGWRTAPMARASGDPEGGDADRAGLSIGDFLHLGPLGTALLPYKLPRVLLIDEMDKSDFDLPNDLLNIFEDGDFAIPELVRLRNRTPEVVVHTADRGHTATVRDGVVRCHEFPIVIVTSNGERDFSGAFLRRCLRLEIPDPDADRLAAMVAAHFPKGTNGYSSELIAAFLERRRLSGSLAADQLLHAVHLATSGAFQPDDPAGWNALVESLWSSLSPTGP